MQQVLRSLFVGLLIQKTLKVKPSVTKRDNAYSVPRQAINNNLKMNIKNKIYHTVYFLLFGIIVGILRWSICIVDTNGTMDFTPFLQAFLLIVALLLFVILDIILHKVALRAISITILLCFNIWSYTYYFKIEELQEYWSGLKYSPYDAYLPPNIDDFIFVWLASQILVFYLFLTIGISYLLKRKKLLTKQDNGKPFPA